MKRNPLRRPNNLEICFKQMSEVDWKGSQALVVDELARCG